MRRIGRIGKEWLKVRKKWVTLNPPNHQGYYICAMCGRWVPADEMELDHTLPRSARPDLRFDLDNLKPMHSWCNRRKGSKHA